jgi:hypothetical protein
VVERAGILRRRQHRRGRRQDLHYAYVYFDRHRARAVPAILAELERRGIYSIGRYGAWGYLYGGCDQSGKRLAERLNVRGHSQSA